MELVIFIGMQGSGKSTFFRERFFDTHVRINLDMLKTRHREKVLFEACLAAKQPMVIDNTNPTPADRARYIPAAKAAGFRVIGYYFDSDLESCRTRNESRTASKIIPLQGLIRTLRALVPPVATEGFDGLSCVTINSNGEFVFSEPGIQE
ncbi:MAG: ATP-binding protein [Planctomycetaceae bacterium]|nr:ATP-binding protein [Planctomycetaceae bacterium]